MTVKERKRLSWIKVVLTVLSPAPVALLPTLVMFTAQSASVPPALWILARVVLITTALTLGVTLLLIARGTPVDTAATAVTCGAAIAVLYPLVDWLLLSTLDKETARLVALSYVGLCLLVVWIVAAQKRIASIMQPSSRVVAAGLGLSFAVQFTSVYLLRRERVTQPATLLVTDGQRPVVRPDIYHVILDGFGRHDVLAAQYELDLSDFIGRLESRGFRISKNGMANYTHTTLSMASMMNGVYLDSFVQPGDVSQVPIVDMIQNSSVVKSLKTFGYEFTFIGSNFPATIGHRQADTCVCWPPIMGELESGVLWSSVVRDIGLGGLDYREHRERIRDAFEILGNLPPAGAPRLVMAHIFTPHPPFVFDQDGRDVHPGYLFSWHDGSGFPGAIGAYNHGYPLQTRYVAGAVTEAVDRILNLINAQKRQAVIVVHGDHGPRQRWHAQDATKTDPSESLPVLLAVRWPDGQSGEDLVSLVNVYRVLFRSYFDPELSVLPDRGFVSSWRRPFSFIEVPQQ